MPAASTVPGLSPASADLGLGGMLADQVKGETDEMRKKRLQQQQIGQMGAANMSLFGVPGGTST